MKVNSEPTPIGMIIVIVVILIITTLKKISVRVKNKLPEYQNKSFCFLKVILFNHNNHRKMYWSVGI